MRLKIAILAALAMVGVGYGRAQDPPSQAQKRIFGTSGMVMGTSQDDDGAVFLTLWDAHIRFRVAPQSPGELESLLSRAADGARSVDIRYDGAAGRVNEEAGTVDYPLCALALDKLRFEPATRCADGPRPAGALSGEAALALALAYLGEGDARRAQSLLERVGSSGEPAFRKLVLRTRAQVADGVASTEAPESPAADRAFLEALTQYRALAALEPDDVDDQYSIAAMLEELGDYDGAKALYEDILRRWPEEEFPIAVRIGAIYRIKGDNARALRELDELAARGAAPDGMKFHYHRAWTLTRLRRFEEAVAELDAGMRTQPDYAYAYLLRGCAGASAGRLSAALADTERGAALLGALPQAGIRSVRFDIDRANAVAGRLKAALAAHGDRPVAGACGGYWGRGDTPRPRSPLLPPA